MELRKGNIRSSPFVGIFAKATEKFVLVPHSALKKEIFDLKDFFGAEIIQTSIANSTLLGLLCVANSKGILVPTIAEESEIRTLEQMGLKVKKLKTAAAIGNLVAVNDSKGIFGNVVSKETAKEIESFLKIELKQLNIANSELAGASLVVTNNGFVANARASKSEFETLEKIFGVKGKLSTANYGDPFVAHSIIANTKGALIGLPTTQHELLRIDDGLRGE